MSNIYQRPSMKAQQGLTLVELMVSSTISLLVLAGAIQVFFGAAITNALTSETSKIQENAQLALALITKDIRIAGYRHPDNGALPDYFVTTGCNSGGHGVTQCNVNGNGWRENSDQISIQYDPPEGGDEADCTGASLGSKEVVANVYWVDENPDGGHSLWCRGWLGNTQSWNGNAMALVDGIEALQVLYGISDGASVTGYVTSDGVSDWSAVVAVKLGLLVSTGAGNGSAQERKRTLNLLDMTPQEITDSHLYRPFSTTIMINNSVVGVDK